MAGLRGRAKQRGKRLDEDCYKAQPLTHEYGVNDKRVFCSGLHSDYYDGDYIPECRECDAFFLNAPPPDLPTLERKYGI